MLVVLKGGWTPSPRRWSNSSPRIRPSRSSLNWKSRTKVSMNGCGWNTIAPVPKTILSRAWSPA